jgi:hypothetical protein
MQAPIVAENVADDIDGRSPTAIYNGYGSCPLTVEKGKIVLAEFGYGGTLLPSFPKWLIDGTKPTRAAWFLKETDAAALLLEGHAARPGMDGETREGHLQVNDLAGRAQACPCPSGAALGPTFLRDRALLFPPARTGTRPKDDRHAHRLRSYIPLLDWGRDYSRDALQNDLIAAVIVTIMLIPQSLAYALLAGLPPEAGLYASILPIILYAIFGTSRALAVGPVAVVSLMTAAAVGQVAEQGTAGYASPRSRLRSCRAASFWPWAC